jgi:TubC N-terminal docking domain
MTTKLLLAELEKRGAKLFVDGELLRWKAPKGAIDAEIRAAVAEHKAELLALLSGSAVAEPDPSTPQPGADGLIHVGPWIQPTAATMDAYRAHWARKRAARFVYADEEYSPEQAREFAASDELLTEEQRETLRAYADGWPEYCRRMKRELP